MSDPYVLPKLQAKRLDRLAAAARRSPSEVLNWVLKDGFEYTEWFVEQVNAGLADLDSGCDMSWDDFEKAVRRQRSERARDAKGKAA
jgi:predicted transcriptional regulator